MISHTLMIFGPGGIGKSPVGKLVREDAVQVDPYRLRATGPRDAGDEYYAHPRLRSELKYALGTLGDHCERIADDPVVEWFPRSQVALFDVRGEWQCLFLGGLSAAYAKAEVFAPAVPALLTRSDVMDILGEITIIILNPVDPLASLAGDYKTLVAATAENCERRGDSVDSATKRANSAAREAIAWREMLDSGAIEFPYWPFPEYQWKGRESETRVAAARTLLDGNPKLRSFLKPDLQV